MTHMNATHAQTTGTPALLKVRGRLAAHSLYSPHRGLYGCTLTSLAAEDAAAVQRAAAEVMRDTDGEAALILHAPCRPPTVDCKGVPVIEEHGLFYAGCWVEAYLTVEAGYGEAATARLIGVRFVKDDTPFAGGRPLSLAPWPA